MVDPIEHLLPRYLICFVVVGLTLGIGLNSPTDILRRTPPGFIAGIVPLRQTCQRRAAFVYRHFVIIQRIITEGVGSAVIVIATGKRF